MNARKRAFTLVEVIVVVAVTLILAAFILARFGRVSADARNVAIHNFLRDCRAVYLRLNYGEPPSYVAHTNVMQLSDYIAATTLGEVQVQLTDTGLSVSNLPQTLFKDGRGSLHLDYQRNRCDGEDMAAFLAKVLW